MKSILVVLAILVLAVSFSLAQEERHPNRFTYTEDASVLPHFAVFAQGTSGILSTGPRAYRANLRFGVANTIELGFLFQEQSINFLAEPQLRPTLALKLRVLDGSASLPSVALMYRTEFGWKPQILWNQDLRHKRPAVVNDITNGLTGAKFDAASSILEVILTQRLIAGSTFSFGGGLHEFRYRSLWIFKATADPGLVAREERQRLLLMTFAQALVPVTPEVSLVAELATIPGTRPLLDRPELQFDRIFFISGGVRYSPVDLVALDAAILHTTPFAGLSNTEVRIGLSTSIHAPGLLK